MDKQPQRYAKDNRTAHITARSDKSIAYVTNNNRLTLLVQRSVAYWPMQRKVDPSSGR